jgi:hypothetical protein
VGIRSSVSLRIVEIMVTDVNRNFEGMSDSV